MKERIITFSDRFGYSRLFQDFIYHPERLRLLFAPDPIEKKISAVASRSRFRKTAVDILNRQNRSWQAPPAAMETISKLADESAAAVFVGQQACLLGGPYLILLKALAAVRLAHKLEAELSVPVVPIFWIAADDHDVREVSSVDVFDISGAVTRLAIDYDSGKIYPPVGAILYDESINRETDRLKSILPDNDFRQEAVSPIARIYRTGATMVDCFASYLSELVGRFGLPLFNPYDRQFKECVAPMMGEIIIKQASIKERLAGTESALRDAGYHVQIQKQESAAFLFHHNPARMAIHTDGGGFAAGDMTFSESQLVDAIATRPLDFSPDALTRPLVQSFFFPTVAYIGGPAEIAYFAQIMPLFELFDLESPQVFSRPSVTVVEERFERLFDRHEIVFEDMAGDFERIINRVMQASFPPEIQDLVSNQGILMNADLQELKKKVIALDPALEEIIDRTREKIDFQLKDLETKIFSFHKKRQHVERERLYRLRGNMYPNGSPAERSIAPVYLISRYGRSIWDFVYENMALDETGHQLLMLSEYYG